MDVNNLVPFDPSVWGNVSDWTMVLITGITGFLILKTLKSQQSITAIERARYVKENMPTFQIEQLTSDNSAIVRRNDHFNISIRLVVASDSNNYAYNFNTGIESQDLWIGSTIKSNNLTIKPASNYKEVVSIWYKKVDLDVFDTTSFKMNLSFSDYYGNFYEQSIYYWIMFKNEDQFSQTIKITLPKEI